jgi:hypothetical protein
MKIGAFLFCYVGALLTWIIKGARGPLGNEMSRVHDSDFKYFRNFTVGFIAIFFLAFVLVKFISP